MKANRTRLGFEALGERIVPATRTWDGPANSQWQDGETAAYWSEDTAPVSGDKIIVPANAWIEFDGAETFELDLTSCKIKVEGLFTVSGGIVRDGLTTYMTGGSGITLAQGR
jgi:hypothetical protein